MNPPSLAGFACLGVKANLLSLPACWLQQEGVEVCCNGQLVTLESRRKIHEDKRTGACTYYDQVRIDDGVSWEAALASRDAARMALLAKGATWEQATKTNFYISKSEWTALQEPHIVLATAHGSSTTYMDMCRPYQTKTTTIRCVEMLDKYTMTTSDVAANLLWEWWHGTMLKNCLHGPRCAKKAAGLECSMGSRIYYKRVITGALQPVLGRLFQAGLDRVYHGPPAWSKMFMEREAEQDTRRRMRSHGASKGAGKYVVKMLVDDGVSWEAALASRDAARLALLAQGGKWKQAEQINFYISKDDDEGHGVSHILVVTDLQFPDHLSITTVDTCTPYNKIKTTTDYKTLVQEYDMAPDDKFAEGFWAFWHTELEDDCLHGPGCEIKAGGQECVEGTRRRYQRMITGDLLPALHTLFDLVGHSDGPKGPDAQPSTAASAPNVPGPHSSHANTSPVPTQPGADRTARLPAVVSGAESSRAARSAKRARRADVAVEEDVAAAAAQAGEATPEGGATAADTQMVLAVYGMRSMDAFIDSLEHALRQAR